LLNGQASSTDLAKETAMGARSLRLLALSLALLPAACGGGGSSSGSGGTEQASCQPGQFKLAGYISTQDVQVTALSEGSGLTQVGTGQLDVGADPDPSAPARPQLHLTWPQGLVDGTSSVATGTFTPIDGPLAGQTLCVGAGTTVIIFTDDKGVGFTLKGFASGANCDMPVSGEVDGCWD
jgi:hypothetical protein